MGGNRACLLDKWPQGSRRAWDREIRQADVRTSPRKLRGPMLSRGDRARQRVTEAGCSRKNSLRRGLRTSHGTGRAAARCTVRIQDPQGGRWFCKLRWELQYWLVIILIQSHACVLAKTSSNAHVFCHYIVHSPSVAPLAVSNMIAIMRNVSPSDTRARLAKKLYAVSVRKSMAMVQRSWIHKLTPNDISTAKCCEKHVMNKL